MSEAASSTLPASSIFRLGMVIVLLLALVGIWWWNLPEETNPPATHPPVILSAPLENPFRSSDLPPPAPGSLAELLNRFYLPHMDLSTPQPLPQAMDRLIQEVRSLNYLKRPALDRLHYDASWHDVEETPSVSCPLTEPSLAQVLQWFAAQLTADPIIGESGRISFRPWPPANAALPGGTHLEIHPSWLEPARGDSADPEADALPRLTARELLETWRVFPDEEEVLTLSQGNRRLTIQGSGRTARQATHLAQLRRENQPQRWEVTLRIGSLTAGEPPSDRIIADPDLQQWLAGQPELPVTSRGFASSGQLLSLEKILPEDTADAQDWLGHWAGLLLRAEGEVARISGTIEHRHATPEAAAPVSLEAEFEAFVPRQQTLLIRLNGPAARSLTTAVSVK